MLANPSRAPRPSDHAYETHSYASYKTTLIVVPSTLVQQWEDEVRRFAPQLKVTHAASAFNAMNPEASPPSLRHSPHLDHRLVCLQVNVYFEPPEAAGPRRDYEFETFTVPFYKDMQEPTWDSQAWYSQEITSFSDSEGSSEDDRDPRASEKLSDDDGEPMYKLGLTFDEKMDKDGKTMVIIDHVGRDCQAPIRENRVLVMINKELCPNLEVVRSLIAKAKRTPTRPVELMLRTQTKRAEQSGSSSKAKKPKKAMAVRRQDTADLRDCDVLIMSPRQLAPSNFLRAQLENTEFHRLVVDESHLVGSRYHGEEISLDYLMAVRAAHTWLLTGTPYSSALSELGPQCALLGQDAWLQSLLQEQATSSQAAADTMRQLMIRHTKAQRIEGEAALALPAASFRVVWLEHTNEERQLYQQHMCMTPASSSRAPPRGNVRQLLAHLEAGFTAQRLALAHKYTAVPLQPGQASVAAASADGNEDGTTQGPHISSTKYAWLEQELRTLLACESSMRVVIFTHDDDVQARLVQWLTALARSGESPPHWTIDDINQRTPARLRHRIIADFQAPLGKQASGARLFVATLSVAAVGLTLTAASRVFLLEPTFDPSLAAQAAGRIHRLGQSREICIYQLAYKGTLDESILTTHDKIRDGSLTLTDGRLPDEVQDLFDRYRRSHSWVQSDNDADVASAWMYAKTPRLREREKAIRTHAVPLKCSFGQCVHCGAQKDAVFGMKVPQLIAGKRETTPAPGEPQIVSPRVLSVRVGYRNGDRERPIRVHVAPPASAREGDIISFSCLGDSVVNVTHQLKGWDSPKVKGGNDAKVKGGVSGIKDSGTGDTKAISVKVQSNEASVVESSSGMAAGGKGKAAPVESDSGVVEAVALAKANGKTVKRSRATAARGAQEAMEEIMMRETSPQLKARRAATATAASSTGGGGGGGSGGTAPGKISSPEHNDPGRSKRDVHEPRGVTVGFSGFDQERRERLSSIMRSLRGVIEERADVSGCSHLVVNVPLKRTTKLCVAVSLPAVKLVTAEWISACEMAGAFVSADPFLLRGEHTSEKMGWSFNATAAAKAAIDAPGCFHGVSFYVTADCVPSSAEFAPILAAAGGNLLEMAPGAGPSTPQAIAQPGVIVISTYNEVKVWRKLGALSSVRAVLRADHVLTCALRQALDVANGRLVV